MGWLKSARSSALMVATGGMLLVGACSENSPSDPTPAPPAAHDFPIRPGPTTAAQADDAKVPHGSDVMAYVHGHVIDFAQLEAPLMEAHGLDILLNLVQLDLAKQHAAQDKVVVTQADIDRERELTLRNMFPDSDAKDYDDLLDHLLQQQHVTRAEFDIVMQINAYLRKIAEPHLAAQITPEKLKQTFDVLYGSRYSIQVIQVDTLQKAAEAKRLLAAGQSFEQVAMDMSQQRQSAMMGGHLPQFSMAQPGISDAMKQAVLSLKVGEVSDPVGTEGVYEIIKLDEVIPPKAVKFDDVQTSIRQQYLDNISIQAIKELRTQLAQQAMEPGVLQIVDPRLRAIFEARTNDARNKNNAEERLRQELHHPLPEKPNWPPTQPATGPAGATTGPANGRNPLPPLTPTTHPAPATHQAPRIPTTGTGE